MFSQTDRRTDGRTDVTSTHLASSTTRGYRVAAPSGEHRAKTMNQCDRDCRPSAAARTDRNGKAPPEWTHWTDERAYTCMTRAPAPNQNKQHATGADVMLRRASGRRARVSRTGLEPADQLDVHLLMTEMTDIRHDGHFFCLHLSAFYSSELTQNRTQTVSATSTSLCIVGNGSVCSINAV